jgi:ABC-type spermidine/putrescine transport system permease subunit II
LLDLYILIFFGFVILPMATVALFSFNDFPYYSLPLKGLTLKWYSQLFTDPRFVAALKDSLLVALATGILATVLGTSFAFGITRERFRWKAPVTFLGFLPLLTPLLVLGITFQLFFVLVGIPLSRATVVVAHTTYAIPFVTLVVLARLLTFDPTFEAAARDLGASRAQTFLLVTFPLTRGAIQGGAIVAFLLSFNEFIISFHTSAGFFTLPVLIYSMQRVGLRPDLLAYSTLVLAVVTVTLFLLRRIISGLAAQLSGGHDAA